MKVYFNQSVNCAVFSRRQVLKPPAAPAKLDISKLTDTLKTGRTEEKRDALKTIKGHSRTNGDLLPSLKLLETALNDVDGSIRLQAVNVLKSFDDRNRLAKTDGARELFDKLVKDARKDKNSRVAKSAQQIKLNIYS